MGVVGCLGWRGGLVARLFERFRLKGGVNGGFVRLVWVGWGGLGVCDSGWVFTGEGGAGSAELGQAAEVVEDGLVGAGPGPSGWEAEQEAASVVDNAAGDAVEANKDGASDSEHPGGLDAAEVFDPSDQVVGEHRAGEPAGVGVETPGGQVSEAAFFEIADSELNRCVTAVLPVRFDGGQLRVGGEGVVPPVGPDLGLVSDQPGSADHQPQGFGRPADERLRDLGCAAVGVIDRLPGGFGDVFDSFFDIGAEGNGYRPAHPQAVQLFDQAMRPEPGVGPHRDLPLRAGAAGAVDGLGNEVSVALL